MSEPNVNISEKSVIQLLQEIHSGQVNPRVFDKPSRQMCVDFLKLEGYTNAQIAQVLKCSERTVTRDISDIQDRHKMRPNPDFVMKFIGDVFRKAMHHHDSFLHLARAKETSVCDKIQAELAAWKVLKELVDKLQSLGYLPLRPQEVIGDIFHHLDGTEEESLVEIQKMVVELETVSQEQGSGSPELLSELQRLKARIETAEISTEVKKIVEKQREDTQQEEDSNV
ncbi:MAG: hypothetical protein PHS64_00560 [Candidatus Omnitrophica bacterium]|nr:hypothetical protein [Candidatus Omnitrophota bacterium]